MTFSGNIKGGVNGRSLFLTNSSGRPLSTWGEHIQFLDRCFLGNHSFIIYLFLLDQLILGASNWMFNFYFNICNCFIFIFTTHSTRVISMSLKFLELTNILVHSFVFLIFLNITKATGLINIVIYCYKMIVQCVVFEFICIRFFQKCFFEVNYFRVVAGQNVLEFFIIGPDSSAVPLNESWAACFVWVVGVDCGGLGLFFFLFLVLFDSSVSILSKRLNLFLVSMVWFERIDNFSRSCPINDGIWYILHCGEYLHLSQFCSRFGLPNLDEGGRIGDLWKLNLAGDFLLWGVVWGYV